MSRIERALERAAQAQGQPQTQGRGVFSASELTPGMNEPRSGLDCLLDVEPLEINNPLLMTGGAQNPGVNEEYNRLRSMVINMTKSPSLRNTLLITSTVSAEGKTLTALNLSIALAREYDHTVLLVDTDLRRPSVHHYLGLKPDVGLTQCLKGEARIEEALIKTGIGKLVVLPAGAVVSNPIELLSSKYMKQIVVELKNRYKERFVLFDSPPALSYADAQVLADIVDATLYVVREGAVNEKQLKKSLGYFNDKNLLGVVYNDASFSSTDMYSYY